MPYGKGDKKIKNEKFYEYCKSGNYEKALVENYLNLEKTPREYNLEKLELTVHPANEEMIELVKSIESKYSYGKVHYGRIGSGDVWNREIDRIKWFNKKLKTSCEEMEALSVYKIANMNNIPVIAIKVISNNEILQEKYDILTVNACQEFVYLYIKECIHKFGKFMNRK